MLLAGALFALFMMGFWLYCLTDAILTPPGECRGMSKPAWIAVITVTFIGQALGPRGPQGARRRPGVPPRARPSDPRQLAGRRRGLKAAFLGRCAPGRSAHA